MNLSQEGTQEKRVKSTVDQEAWVLKRLEEYSTLVTQVYKLSNEIPGGGQPMIHGAIQGATHNLVVEIMRTLNVEPAFVNIGSIDFDRHGKITSLHSKDSNRED